MIAKNEAKSIRSCLESVNGIVSQIVIGDTGSSDETPNIARECGATVVSVPWEDHFAKARNAVLEHMTTDWVLVLDADEELDPNAKQLLPGLLDAADISAYLVTHRLYMRPGTSYSMEAVSNSNNSRFGRAQEAGSCHDVASIKLFRRDPRIYFFGRIHELIEYRICALGLAFPKSDIVVHNFSYLGTETLEARARKNDYYRELGRLKVKEEADNPLAWFDLGKLEYETYQNLEFALSCFRRASRLHPPFTRAWLFAAEINLRLKQPKQALAALAHADSTKEVPIWRERLRGDILLKLGQVAQARMAYAQALQLSGADPLIESRLGYSEVRLGEVQSGFQKLRRAADQMPHRAEVRDLLVEACVFTGDLAGAEAAVERFAACNGNANGLFYNNELTASGHQAMPVIS